MKKNVLFLSFGLILFSSVWSQTILDANGPGNTYEEINNAFAPGHDVVEVPDCNHAEFGRHIDEAFDTELNSNVFLFYIHKTPDNDRCKKLDRQRVEIKTYGKSPDSLIATEGETVEYKWKFKLDVDFQPSSGFTHIHQIKTTGSTFSAIPMITLTARKAKQDRLELRYTSTDEQNTIKTAALDLFKGHWVEVTELITYGDTGRYFIEIKKISTGEILLTHTNNAIDTWQNGSDFARPKWGIYRSLKNSADLRDEIVRFAHFSIKEIKTFDAED